MQRTALTMFALVATATTAANAAIVIDQSSTPTTYAGHSVTFDEAGVPIGVVMDPFTFYQPTDGITFGSGSGFLVAEDWDAIDGIDGGEGTGNSLNGGFSIRMLFDAPINEIAWQGWANGSPNPPLGGINVFLFRDDVQVAAYSGIAPFGGVGDEWFNVTSSGDAEAFDEIRFFNGAFSSFNSYVDNITWNSVPAPGAIALFGLAGLVGRRRR